MEGWSLIKYWYEKCSAAGKLTKLKITALIAHMCFTNKLQCAIKLSKPQNDELIQALVAHVIHCCSPVNTAKPNHRIVISLNALNRPNPSKSTIEIPKNPQKSVIPAL